MDSTQSVWIAKRDIYGTCPLKDVVTNYYHLYDSRIGRIFFCYTKRHPTLMYRITIEWSDESISTLAMIGDDAFKIKYKDGYRRIDDLDVGCKSHFGWHNKKGKIIKKEHIVARPTYMFTTIDRIEVNGVLIKCKISRSLRHTKTTSRISKWLCNPSICPLINRLL